MILKVASHYRSYMKIEVLMAIVLLTLNTSLLNKFILYIKILYFNNVMFNCTREPTNYIAIIAII